MSRKTFILEFALGRVLLQGKNASKFQKIQSESQSLDKGAILLLVSY